LPAVVAAAVVATAAWLEYSLPAVVAAAVVATAAWLEYSLPAVVAAAVVPAGFVPAAGTAALEAALKKADGGGKLNSW